jgi:hypothetical protein
MPEAPPVIRARAEGRKTEVIVSERLILGFSSIVEEEQSTQAIGTGQTRGCSRGLLNVLGVGSINDEVTGTKPQPRDLSPEHHTQCFN